MINNINIMEDNYLKLMKMIYSRYYLDLIDCCNGTEFTLNLIFLLDIKFVQ